MSNPQSSSSITLSDNDEDSILFDNLVRGISSNHLAYSGLVISQNGVHLPLSFPSNINNIVSSNQDAITKIEEPPVKKKKTKCATTARSKKSTIKKFRPYQDEKWQERYNELVDFCQKNGHCLVPHTFPKNPALARWVKRQRYQYTLLRQHKKSSITLERIKILEKINFVWDSHEAVWQERLKELLAYKDKHGSCSVPSTHSKYFQLATWVKCQRRQFRLFHEGCPSNMTVDRILALEGHGFEWEVRSQGKKRKSNRNISMNESDSDENTSCSSTSYNELTTQNLRNFNEGFLSPLDDTTDYTQLMDLFSNFSSDNKSDMILEEHAKEIEPLSLLSQDNTNGNNKELSFLLKETQMLSPINIFFQNENDLNNLMDSLSDNK